MKKIIIAMFSLASSAAFANHTTLECQTTQQNPLENTTFHVPYTVKVQQRQLKMKNELTDEESTLDLIGVTSENGGWRYYGEKSSETFVMVQNRNWESSSIELFEQMFLYSGDWTDSSEEFATRLQFDCKTVPTLTRKF